MKIVIIGAVAGGASAAARARRLGEDAKIILIERGTEPSFANCGLPYYVGGVINRANWVSRPACTKYAGSYTRNSCSGGGLANRDSMSQAFVQ